MPYMLRCVFYLRLRYAQARGVIGPVNRALVAVGIRDLKILAAGSRSLRRESVRLTFLVEMFGDSATTSAVDKVMRTGHNGSEYV